MNDVNILLTGGGLVETDQPVFTSFAVDTEKGVMSGEIKIRDKDGYVWSLSGKQTATLLGTDDLKNDFEPCGDLELEDGVFGLEIPDGKSFFKAALPYTVEGVR